MSSTPSSCCRERSRNGSARITRACSASTVHGSIAQMATICWARTSSGLRGMRVSSIAPSSMRRTTTAASSRSLRWFGKILPTDGSPTWCPARPMRCSPAATLGGASIWTTRSIAPMSIPSSRLEVATSAGQPPGLQRLLDLQPLLARDAAVVRQHQLLAGELVQAAAHPLGQPARVDEDQGGPMRPDQLEQGRVDARPDRVALLRPVVRRQLPSARWARSSTGTITSSSSVLPAPASAICDLAPGSAQEGGDRRQRTLRGRQADPLRLGHR